jgi:hypothetical protein
MADPIDELRKGHCSLVNYRDAILSLAEKINDIVDLKERVNKHRCHCPICEKTNISNPPEEKKEDELLDMFLFLWDYKASWKTNLRTIAFELRKDPNRWFYGVFHTISGTTTSEYIEVRAK